MDLQLQERLTRWHKHIDQLKKIEAEYFSLEASEKHLFSRLFLESEGKNIAEREANAYGSSEWKQFKEGLAEAKSAYNTSRRELDLKIKAFEATYITYKLESEAVRKAP